MFAVSRVDASVTVHVELADRMIHDVFQSGGGVDIFGDTVIQFLQTVAVVRDVGADVPCEVAGADDVAVGTQFESFVFHHAYVFPTVAFARDGI